MLYATRFICEPPFLKVRMICIQPRMKRAHKSNWEREYLVVLYIKFLDHVGTFSPEYNDIPGCVQLITIPGRSLLLYWHYSVRRPETWIFMWPR